METPWAVLLCKFNDANLQSEPFTRDFYERFFTTAGSGSPNLVDFFQDVSHGTLDLSGSRVFGWYTLGQPRSAYSNDGAGRLRFVGWARQAAMDAGVDLAPFFGVIVCVNVAMETYGGGGPLAVCDSDGMNLHVLGQEVSHGYGLQHSRLVGSSYDYGDRWDIMGDAPAAPHPEFGSMGPIMNAWNMRSRGWLDETRVWRGDAGGFDTRIELRPLIYLDLPGSLAAELPGGYLVEFRVKEGWDARIPNPAVLVHRWRGDNSYLVPTVLPTREDCVPGVPFQIGDGSSSRPFLRMEVEALNTNPSAQRAFLHLVYRPAELGNLGAFYRGDGGWLVWRAYGDDRWHGEEVFDDRHPAPTRLGSAPAVVAGWNDHRFAVFFRGEDNRLRWKAHHAGRWHGDAPIDGGGILISDPAIVDLGTDELAAFYRVEGDWLAWRGSLDGSWFVEEVFGAQHAVPTRMSSAPAVVAGWNGHRFAVFFRGTDNRLHWKAHHAGRWHGDAPVEGGGILTSDPAVVAFGTGELGVFYRGEGDWLVWRAYSGGRWHGEEIFDDRHPVPTRMSSAPTVVAGWAGHRFAVFFRDADNRLRWKAHHGGRWHGDAPVDGGGILSSDPTVVAWAPE